MIRMPLIVALFVTSAYAAEIQFNAIPAMRLSPLPQGWAPMGGGGGGPHQLPGVCEHGVDSQSSEDGPQLLSIRCTNESVPSFGGVWQGVAAARYQGKRVRVSGWVKVTDVERVENARYPAAPGEAGLYLGVGSPSKGMRQDRMSARSINGTIKGSTDWEYREFVVDIPKDSRQLQIGFWMEGKGQVWARNMQVEKVSKKMPLNFHPVGDSGFGITLK
jgi:hypothetical protein